MANHQYRCTWDWSIRGRYVPQEEIVEARNAKEAHSIVMARYIPKETRFPFHLTAKRIWNEKPAWDRAVKELLSTPSRSVVFHRDGDIIGSTPGDKDFIYTFLVMNGANHVEALWAREWCQTAETGWTYSCENSPVWIEIVDGDC